MPKALELNIPLDSCGGLDLQSTLICHYVWVCSCLGVRSEDAARRKAPALESRPSTAPGCSILCVRHLDPHPRKSWGYVAGGRREVVKSSSQGSEQGEEGVTCTHTEPRADARRCVCWLEWWKGQGAKGLKHKLQNANSYRSHSEPLLNMTRNPDWCLTSYYNLEC